MAKRATLATLCTIAMLRRPRLARLPRLPHALLVIALSLSSAVFVTPRVTSASAAIALTLKDLVDRSEYVFVGIPKSRSSRWEAGRIITYTVVGVDSVASGAIKAGDSITIRTLGGVVGDIGQIVHGEAVLPLSAPALLFIYMTPSNAPPPPTSLPESRYITGMSQGVLPVTVGDDLLPRIGASAMNLALYPSLDPAARAATPASVSTVGRKVSDVVVEVRAIWAARAKK
ncbi:MAG: hypothetical protein NVS3B20_11430 [Polyangiales bacterium]